ncbi:MAG TPA: hypothetical protein VGM82_13640 [Gemmatimonadaceae bacterium]
MLMRTPGSSFTYILPIKRDDALGDAELTAYLRRLGAIAQLVVVDASPGPIFEQHARAWADFATHVPVAADIRCANGKARGVLTALPLAAHELIIIADDDVRYEPADVDIAAWLLRDAHVLRPQNYFAPLPWHGLWDTGRTLLNRATDGDWPGTLILRRSALRVTGGYDGNVLFENFELVQTIIAAGGTARLARSLFVRRLPPTAKHFRGQRVRQAYDEVARPARLIVQLTIAPLVLFAMVTGHPIALLFGALAVVALAEYGRRRDGGAAVFPARASLFAPLWLAERAACIWIALGWRIFRGGVPYAGGILGRAATPMRALRRRYAGTITSTSIGLNDPLFDSSAEQAVIPTTSGISARTVK